MTTRLKTILPQRNLEILEIEMPYRGDVLFYDHGYVDNIADYVMDLGYYHTGRVIIDKKISSSTEGICVPIQVIFKSGNLLLLNIFYRHSLLEQNNVHTRAHEETHVLDQADELDLLANKLLEEQRVRVDFKAIRDEEVKADVGALKALVARWGLCEFPGINPEAKRIYTEGRIAK